MVFTVAFIKVGSSNPRVEVVDDDMTKERLQATFDDEINNVPGEEHRTVLGCYSFSGNIASILRSFCRVEEFETEFEQFLTAVHNYRPDSENQDWD